MTEDSDDLFVFNGIDGSSGRYLLQPMAPKSLVDLAQGKDPDEVQAEAAQRYEDSTSDHYAPREDVDPKSIAQSGWGIIFAHDADPAIVEALQPLLDHRKAEAASINPERYREFSGSSGYRPNERKAAFLTRQKAPTSGPVDPDRMPYYLLIVGSPEQISTEFQAQLDLQHAVGRLHFETLDEYESYAHSVIASETGKVKVARRLGLFGVKHDRATKMSAEGLIAGLDRYVQDKCPDWTTDVRVEEQATKAELTKLLGGEQTPAVLFTASHGVGFPNGDPRQLAHQGALLCQDWSGSQRAVLPEEYFCRDDLGDSARLAGLITFLFACYGGGTPKYDAFFHRSGERTEIAPHAFMAGLPTRMLGHPRGGALAAVAHVERAWGCSFYSRKVGHQIAVFESFMKRLLDGHPVGSALDCFGNRYGELSSGLLEKLEGLKYGEEISEVEIANDWTANNDARNYVVLGDPAVRVPVVDEAQAAPRPGLEFHSRLTDSQQPPTGAQSPPAGAEPPSADSTPDGDEGLDYGILDRLAGKSDEAGQGGVGESLRGFVSKLGQRISDALTDMSTLDVKTYVTTDMSRMTVEDGEVAGADLRAYTRVSLDGDTIACVPERDGEIDTAVLEIHMRMVQQAQQARADLMQTMIQAATGLVGFKK
ncbi:MAG: hypothetical protein AAGF11_22100 [Myxococcota bacterium]